MNLNFTNMQAFRRAERRVVKVITLVFFLILGSLESSFGQASQQAKTLTKTQVREMVSALADSIGISYVDEKIAADIRTRLKQQLAKGEYDKIETPQALSALLSSQLIAYSNDLHFGVDVAAVATTNVQRRMPGNYNHLAPYNYYFEKMEIMPGNIGLLQIDQFVPPEYTGHLIVAAMNFLSNCDALIIDLRNCIGGDPRTVAQISGFFFKEPTLLHLSRNRAANRRDEFWSTKTSFQGVEKGRIAFTTDTVRAIKADYNKLTQVPIYVLTSNYTFSSGEAMAFGLQTRQRAKTVGETTGKGGNGIRPFSLPHGFNVFIPFTEMTSPVTGKGYQHTGVLPDIAVSPAKALDKAYETALKDLLVKAADQPTKQRLSWELRVYELRKNRTTPTDLKPFAGRFGIRTITFEDGDLYYQREGGTKKLLEPVGKNQFVLDKQSLIEISLDYKTLQIQQLNGSVNKYERTS